MASNNPSDCSPSSSRLAYRSGPTSPPAPGKAQVPVYDSDGLESDDDTLFALSSLAQMERSRVSSQSEEDNFPQQQKQKQKKKAKTKKAISSTPAVFDNSTDCIDSVQQAIDAVEQALARCPKYERREALTELLMHAKLEQAKKATAYSSDCFQHANLWAAMLMQVQELGRNYPKDPQVHQLVYLVQQCVVRGLKREVPEDDGHSNSDPCDTQHEKSKHVDEIQQQQFEQQQFERQQLDLHQQLDQHQFDDESDLCGRMSEAAIDVDVALDGYDDIGYRITEVITEAESNQAEDETDGVDSRKHDDDRDASTRLDETEFEVLDEPVTQPKESAAPTPTRMRMLLPILTGNVVVKGVQVPRLPRGSDGNSSSDSDKPSTPVPKPAAKLAGRSARHKFQFPEKELLDLLEDEEVKPLAPSPNYRRLSLNPKITGTVPLRRKSFSMKRSPHKSPTIGGFCPLPVVPSRSSMELSKESSSSPNRPIKQLYAARRKSTTACHIVPGAQFSRRNSKSFSVAKHQILAFDNAKKTAASPKRTSESPRTSSTSSPPSPVPSTQTQMVLRVRERTSDGVPELVISKKPVRFVAWHWNDRCIRVPFMSAANFMELGPAQHGIMLRQLRYVKSMMHELPWAKAHLRSLLSKYTAKEVSKEELYPQLNALGLQVQREINARAKQQRALTARKQHLTVTLTLATSVVNDTLVTKFGRRGRPHASRLLYDPTSPLQLRWRRKHGERSVEYLATDEIQVIESSDNSRSPSGAGSFGRGNKKAAAAVAVDPESCLSLVTPSRSLDLQVASALHREWLANAVRDIVSFAKQYKVAKANTANLSDSSSSSESTPNASLTRRTRHLPPSRNVAHY